MTAPLRAAGLGMGAGGAWGGVGARVGRAPLPRYEGPARETGRGFSIRSAVRNDERRPI